MFRCQNPKCGKTTSTRQPENLIAVERRKKTYENMIRRGKQKGRMKITEGWEIAKQWRVCPKCFEGMTGQTPQKARPSTKPAIVEARRPRFNDRPPKKTWQNPRKKKNGIPTKQDKPERKKPIVEVVHKAPSK